MASNVVMIALKVRGMMWATTTGSSVGSVASAVRNRIELFTSVVY